MSSGKSRCTGPGGSPVAMPMAWARTAATAPSEISEGGLYDGGKEGLVVDPHLGAPAHEAGGVVAGDGDDRRAVQEGASDAGCEVGRAGTDGGHADARNAGEASDGLGHEAGGGLAGGEDEVDLAAAAQSFDEGQNGTAGNAKDPADAGALKHMDGELNVVHSRVLARDGNA